MILEPNNFKIMNADQIIQRLIDDNYESYFVGGCVRDMLLNLKAKDKDIVTKARPQQIIDLFSDCDVKLVGKSFGVVIVDNVEVATFRKDRYFGLDDKNVKISFADTLKEDLKRRDFTINAMAFDPVNKSIIDHFMSHIDLKNRVIRFVGNPDDRIFEDPNRIIRSARFLAKIHGKYEYNTLKALKKYAHFVKKYVAPERIRLEILKAMELDKPSLFFDALQTIGVLEHIFFYLNQAKNFYHGKHHSEDVYEHSMICGDSLNPKKPLLRLTGYLHDIGKIISYEDDQDGNRTFYNHDRAGFEWIANNLMDKLKFSEKETKYISNLIKVHMRGLKQASPKAIRRLLKSLDEKNISYQDFLRLKIADRKGNLKKNNYSFGDVRRFVEKYKKILIEGEKKPFMKLVIDGHDIMEITGLSSGKEIGRIKDYLIQSILNNPELNNIEDLSDLITEFRQHFILVGSKLYCHNCNELLATVEKTLYENDLINSDNINAVWQEGDMLECPKCKILLGVADVAIIDNWKQPM